MLADFLTVFISNFFKAKFIVEVNGDIKMDRDLTNKNKIITKVLLFMQRIVLVNASYIAVPTRNIKYKIVCEYGFSAEKVIYLENGIDLKNDEVKGFSYPNYEGKIIFGFAGTFSVWQGIDLIVEAIEFFSDDALDKIRFLMVGDGPEYNRIKSLLNTRKLASYFLF